MNANEIPAYKTTAEIQIKDLYKAAQLLNGHISCWWHCQGCSYLSKIPGAFETNVWFWNNFLTRRLIVDLKMKQIGSLAHNLQVGY